MEAFSWHEAVRKLQALLHRAKDRWRSEITENQKQVYPLICAGGHATSFDTRISQLGLVAGTPFPPMRILIVTTEGPGQPFGFIDYCKSIGMEVH